MRTRIKNAKIVNSRQKSVTEGEVLVQDNLIVEVGKKVGSADRTIDAGGKYVIPGLIDAHVHIESSLLTPTEFSRAVSKHGTTTVIADCHEICNVVGVKGLYLFLRETEHLPIEIFFAVPSCVPASHLGSSGAALLPKDIRKARSHERVIGLGELMNFPGVLERQHDIVAKIRACKGMAINGHAPGLRGKAMKDYFDAGIMDDHESLSFREMDEKAAYGVVNFIREGSAEKSKEEQYRLLRTHPHKVCFCSDDKSISDIETHGSVIQNVNRAIQLGYDPLTVIRCATYNTAKHYRLDGVLGNVEPRLDADFFLSKSLRRLKPEMVFINGEIVYSKGKGLKTLSRFRYPDYIRKTVRHRPITREDLKMPDAHRGNVISAREGSLHTGWKKVKMKSDYDLRRDILKIAVIERYRKEGNISVGQITGFGLKRGAIGTTVAHDCHNIVVMGTSDEALVRVANQLIRMGGGFAAYDGKKMTTLPLPIAGLMSQERFDVVSRKLRRIRKAAYGQCRIRHPFATLSFMALEVIPDLKITDKGLVDVKKFKLIK